MDIGVIGLGVMGENLIMNMLDRGHGVSVYNRTVEKTEKFISSFKASDKVKGYRTLEEMVSSLKSPRKILLMVTAGDAVDRLLDALGGFLSPQDVVVDGGNSNYRDTERRCKEKRGKFFFIGCGISGGEEGARKGPSLMPGGHKDGWKLVSEIFSSIAAVSASGSKCCEWIGDEGSGHLAKTVHNGIEYAEMQIIADFYQILRNTHSPKDISSIFQGWGASGTSGFLLEAAQIVLNKKNGTEHMIDEILDASEQKGTGAWTSEEAIRFGVPASIISDSVVARIISGQKELRKELSKVAPAGFVSCSFEIGAEDMRKAFLLCRALSYMQGFNLIREISNAKSWGVSREMLCRVWSNGCIIRSEFLKTLEQICEKEPMEQSKIFLSLAMEGVAPLRKIASYCVNSGVSVPCLLSSLSYYDMIRTESSSGNMIQALRDYFGSHTLVLKTSKERVHINWT